MIEKEIETSLRRALEADGWTTEKNHGSLANFGRPDLHVSHPDWGEWWIEMKKPGGKLGSKQFAWMLKWDGTGVRILVYDEPTPDTLYRLMRAESYGLEQWQPWMTAKQKREARTGRTSLDDALDYWGS